MARRMVRVYPVFERLWHWTQAALIFTLVFTGFAMNGVHALLPFKPAVMLHTIAALTLLAVWIFATFWLFTTGTWKQFIPRAEGMVEVARFYAWGVFRGEHHPHRKIYWRKHNPLQAFAYFGLKGFVFPAIWASGLLYLTYNLWDYGAGATGALVVIRDVHILAAYVIVAFVIVHLYLLTVGHSFREHVRPMVTGFDCIDLTPEQEAYLRANEPERLKDVPKATAAAE